MSNQSPAAAALFVRPMRPEDLSVIVRIHLESFPGFFLSFLGERFLSVLYQSMQEDPESVVIIAELGGEPAGFVAGVTDQSGFHSRLLKRRWRSFAQAAAYAALRQPKIIPRLLRALAKPLESREASAPACLMSIAVRPRYNGRGFGRRLVNAFGEALSRKGILSYCLTTDRVDNEAVNLFYTRQGLTLVRDFVTPEGRPMNEYLMQLSGHGRR